MFKKQGIVPYWLEHPEVCKSEPLNEEEQKELEKLIEQINLKDTISNKVKELELSINENEKSAAY